MMPDEFDMDYFKRLWSVGLGDIGRGLVVAILATPVGIIYDWAMSETFHLSWRSVLKGAIAGGIGYLMKNFFTGENGKLLSDK